MLEQSRAILWAQFRTMRNFYPRGGLTRHLLTAVMSTVWYGMWAAGTIAVAILLAATTDQDRLWVLLSRGLMVAMLYWQVIPVVMLSTGASLDLKRLMVYPISNRQLYWLDVLLSFNTGLEMLLVIAGASVGLWLNPLLPWWSPAGFLPFIALNAVLSPGIRTVLGRLLARKYIRETGFLLLVLAAAVPQMLVYSEVPATVSELASLRPAPWWPWSGCTALAMGDLNWIHAMALPLWVLAALLFSRWQFEVSLRFDYRAAQAGRRVLDIGESISARLVRMGSKFLSDPLGAIVQKELLTLGRSPRFRLVFLMGFTFGLVIWLPISLHGSESGGSFLTENYLTLVSVYALLLLGDVTFWNSFGFDRAAIQVYYVIPTSPLTVLVGKNIAAGVFVLLEITCVALICSVIGMPVSPLKVLEAYAAASILAMYMLGAGNLGSTHIPRPVEPRQYWRTASAGRMQAMLLILYPVIALPLILAYIARNALESEAVFHGLLGLAAVLGIAVYCVSLRSARDTMIAQQENLIKVLSETEGPVTA